MNRHGCHCLLLSLVLLAACAALPGCGRKESTPASSPSPAQGAAVESSPGAALTTAAAPPTLPTVSDPKAAMAAADAALKAKAYDQAALTLVALQQQKGLTDQQAQAVHTRMVQLQGALASALANGDAKAQAAAAILRQSAMH